MKSNRNKLIPEAKKKSYLQLKIMYLKIMWFQIDDEIFGNKYNLK